MAKYNLIDLKVKDGKLIGLDILRKPQKEALTKNNVIYIYRNEITKSVYIGQTRKFMERHKQHYISRKENESFINANFNEVLVITSQLMNGSVLDDIESKLIIYFLADNPKGIKNRPDYDSPEILNRTIGNSVAEYHERERVSSEIILPLWEDDLYERKKWVNTKTLDELRNRELVKYSPLKQLTNQQQNIIDLIESHPDKSYVINGDAGTGKTILLTHLVARILNEQENKKVAVILQPNWIDTAKEIFRVYDLRNSNLTIATSTQLINNQEEFDIIIVDESHKLSRKFSKQMHSFNAVYSGKFSNHDNHLACLKDLGKQIILMYDVLQAIRPANLTREQFNEETKGFDHHYLTSQFRINALDNDDYKSEDYVNGIKYLLYKDTGLLNEGNFNSNFDKSIFNSKDKDSYFGYFENEPLKNLIAWVEEDRGFYHNHINRVVAGLVEPWKQKDGKDPEILHWHEGNIRRRWNSTQTNWINSNDEDAEDQIGSVFAVQGIDLNKVGVLIGNDLQVNNKGELYAQADNFHNINGKFSKSDDTPTNEYEFTIFVLNIYYILLTRGIDGVRIGFWNNDEFKEYMKKTLEIT